MKEIDNLDFIKIKNICSTKNIDKSMKRHREKIYIKTHI